jgi:prepilin-type N-terminal cleavage/methylation domain-containing protein
MNCKAFTLSELLVSLSILGLIAALTLPNIYHSVQERRANAIAKEFENTFANAVMSYEAVHGLHSETLLEDIIAQNMNVVGENHTAIIDTVNDKWAGSVPCSASFNKCWTLQNGAIILTNDDIHFGGDAPNNVMLMALDPDGTDGGNSSIGFVLTRQGKIVTYGEFNGTINYSDYLGPQTVIFDNTYDPTWFKR